MGHTLTVSTSPPRVEVSSKGDAGYVSVSTEATASTFVPEDPVLPKKAPAAPELPFAIVTTTPSSTRREETSAQAPVDQPPGLPMLAVIMSTYSPCYKHNCKLPGEESHTPSVYALRKASMSVASSVPSCRILAGWNLATISDHETHNLSKNLV